MSRNNNSNSPGSDQAYLDIINAAVTAATDAGAPPPPAANTNLADMQRRLSSDSVGGMNDGAGAAGIGMQQPRSSSVESYPLSAGSSASPLMEPDYYGTLNDDDEDVKPSSSQATDAFGQQPGADGEAGYIRRRGTRPQRGVQRAGSVGDIDFGPDQMQQMGMPVPSGSASVDGAMAFNNIDFGTGMGGADPFGPPLGPPPNAPPGNIDVKRRHSTGDLDIDSDLDDYDILDLAPAYVGSAPASMSPDLFGTSASSGAATPSSVASGGPSSSSGQPRRAQRRPSGDLTTKKLSKTVRKRGSTLKKSGSNNSLSSLDGAVARLDVSTETGSVGSLDSPVAGATAASKKTVKDKKPRSWKKPKDKPKRPLSAYNLFFQHERARIVNGGADAAESAAGGADGGAAAAEPADAGGRKKRRHRTAHGKIGFAALAQTIAAKWKTLPASEKTVFEQRAAVEKDRYKREMEVWNKAQKEKRLAEQREQLKQYQEERLRQEMLAKQQQQMKMQQMMAAQRQQLQNSMQAQGHQIPQDQIMGGSGMDQIQSNPQIQQQMMMMQQQQQQQQQQQMGDSVSSLGGSNSNLVDGFGQQQQMQPQAIGSMGGGNMVQQQQSNDMDLHNMNMNQMSMMSSNMLMNNMGRGQAPQAAAAAPSAEDELKVQQAAKLKQIQQAQQILQMQAMAIKRQQQAQGGGNVDSVGGQQDRQVPDNPEFYQSLMNNFQGGGSGAASGGQAQSQQQPNQGGMNNAAMQQMQMMAQMGNSSFNSLGGGDISNANQQQMQQFMMQQQAMQQMQQQQQTFSHPGAQVSMPLNDEALNDNVFDDVATNEELMRVLGAPGNDFGGGEDDVGDEALKEMLNNFDMGNLDSLGFEFDANGQSR